MRQPTIVLAHLSNHSKRENYRFKRLYRNLYNPLFYELFSTEVKMDRHQLLTNLSKLQAGTYYPQPSSRRNPFDRMLTDVVAVILSAIFIPPISAKFLHTQLFTPFQHSTWLCSGPFERDGKSLQLNFLQEKIADEKFLNLIKQLDEAGFLRKQLLKIIYHSVDNDMMESFPEIAYLRIDDHILLGAKGSKQVALERFEMIANMLKARYSIRLNLNRKKLYHREERFPFRQYHIQLFPQTGKAMFFIEKDELIRRLKAFHVVRLGSRGELIPIHRSFLLNSNKQEIIDRYQRDYDALSTCYRYAANRRLMRICHKVLKESMLKTLAYKEKSTVKKLAKSMRNFRFYHG